MKNAPLDTLGFTMVHATEKATLWSCPLGQFWVAQNAQPPCPPPSLDNLEGMARYVAGQINRAMVPVEIKERTAGGAALIRFPARRLLSDEDECFRQLGHDIGPLKKQAELHVPAGWLIEVDGRWLAPVFKLDCKLGERRSMALDRKGRSSSQPVYEWTPVLVGCTDTAAVLAWLQSANASSLQARADERERALQAAADARRERYNQEIDRGFDHFLVEEYARAAEKYSTLAKGRAAGLDQRKGLAQVIAALAIPDFRGWAETWKTRETEKKARPRPARVPDETIERCTVRYVVWYRSGREREECEEHGCRARRYGTKWEIELADGSILIKRQGPNLQILPE
ncbi:hypothetical protein [Thermithiobacillus plumbiphilus]|uniref:Uncharacterized protein n=1 Tax=Thermithiobacillus plumbiphilus TaxID=1729899 RepID=A0ABU9D5B3_9PROT